MAQEQRRFVFVLAQGRSGTNFLAELLDRDPRAQIRHEVSAWDRHILGLSRFGNAALAVEALLEERFAAVLPDDPRVEIYGEVNSFLRYNAAWLRQRFGAAVVHVIRDGRDFVRSAWIRDVLRPEQHQLPIVPADDDRDAERWPRMSRFERICWIWNHTNEVLGATVDRHARLEDLLGSYASFRADLLVPTGLEVSEADWQRAVAKPRNTSSQFRAGRGLRRFLPGRRAATRPVELPAWTDWPEDLTQSFWRICGATMERYGYGRAAGSVPPSSTDVRTGQR